MRVEDLETLVVQDHDVHLYFDNPTHWDVKAVCKAFGMDERLLTKAIGVSETGTYKVVVDVEKFLRYPTEWSDKPIFKQPGR